MAYLASGRDPFDSEEMVLRFGEGHPPLEYLSGVGFDCPGRTSPPEKGASSQSCRLSDS